MDIKVSVLIITYNHEKYIAQAVASALQQDVDFPFEIVIGDDCSTDHTREIVSELWRSHPERIRLLLREEKAGGLPGKTNFVETLKACQGQYVAPLDGDDYWTDPHKLEKMVGFLESHPECSVSFHDAIVLYEDGGEPHRLFPANQPDISTLEDMLNSGIFPIPGTALFRNNLGKLPDCFQTVTNGDWLLFVLLAERGDLGYLSQAMSAYRIHSGGVWSKLDSPQRIQAHTKSWEVIDAHLNFKYHELIAEQIAALPQLQARQHARRSLDQYHRLVKTGELKKGLRLLREAIKSAPAEVFRPQRFLAVLKNGLLGMFFKTSARN